MHLIVAHHGLWGVPGHLNYLLSEIEKLKAEKNLYILNNHRNSELKTYDGIDVCGDRLVEQIEETILELEATGLKVTMISFIGYSLGGLINRFAIGKLYAKGFFELIKPLNFFTIATPHLGVKKKPGNAFSYVWNNSVGFFTLRTGLQFVLNDKDFPPLGADKEPLPLLLAMCDPRGPFYKALKLFSKRILFANTRNDFTARFTTSAIESTNKFKKYRTVVPNPEKYPYIVTIDESTKKEPERWTMLGISYAALFTVLSPILVPFIVGFASYNLMKRRNYRLKEAPEIPLANDWVVNHFAEKVEIEDATELNSETVIPVTVERGEKPAEADSAAQMRTVIPPYKPPTQLPELKDSLACRQWMVDTLNSVGWTKCFAGITYTNAHAAIVARTPAMHEPSFHVIDFMIQEFFSE
ncbi:hypothetical protein HK098_002328 [Nowakowskiella sp. JEL0407]|nr:hypothetical protein HK098_002328 [Nowakowskiella sp. JEL0407]